MSKMNDTIDWSRYDDIAGQLPSLQGYTQFCLFFSDQASDRNRELILRKLEETSIKLTSNFPWLSGKIVNEGSTIGNSGVFKIAQYRSNGKGFDILTREDSLDYQSIVERKAPSHMLIGNTFSPKSDLTHIYDARKVDMPVMIIQVTFLNGGIVLTFAAAHNALDMSGLGKFIEYFGKTYRGEEITTDGLDWGNRDRRTLFQLLGQDEPKLDHSMMIKNQEENIQGSETRPTPTSTRWAYIRFNKEKLDQLKKLASLGESEEKSDHPNINSEWISTDDAISAFLWQRITISRKFDLVSFSPDGADATIISHLCRAVNSRRFFNPPISASYMGHMVSCTFNSTPISSLKTQHLSKITRELRNQLNQISDLSVRSFFSFIHSQADKELVNFTSQLDLSRDLLLSSGAALGVYNVDFGPTLGMPDLVRRPQWGAPEGVAYLMPKTREGHVDAVICLSDQDWARLLQDDIWNQFVEYIG